ncbi:MAG TPA: metallophosphoesterase family protein [Candidatus Omnitrophota bacterium]|nr:metallophosphoesterase family protein [Candidatus Omnitrophota bacterium]
MRYAIFSDIHGNLEALEAVLKAARSERIDAYLCAGDIVGYGANPNECIEQVRSVNAVTVAGNHDCASVGLFGAQDFNPEAQAAIEWTRQHLSEASRAYLSSLPLVREMPELTLVHGSLDEPRDFNYLVNVYGCAATFDLLKTPLCFIGHTHVPVIFIEDYAGTFHYLDTPDIVLDPRNKYIVNAGSVGQPRDSIVQAAYCIFDSSSRSICIRRVKYEVFRARQKIVEAGLPQFLGDRLLTGN